MGQEINQNGNQQGSSAGLGIASMVCGIVSLCFSCMWPICAIASIISIVTGILQIRKKEKYGFAIAGIVLSVFGILFSVSLLLGAAAMISDENGRKILEQYMQQYQQLYQQK